MSSHTARYRISAYDGPPWYTQQFYPQGDTRRNNQPKFLGEIDGWTGFSINEEINSFNTSAEVKYVAQTATEPPKYQSFVLATKSGSPINFNGKYLRVGRRLLNPLRTTNFADSPIDYGVFLRIENQVPTSGNLTTPAGQYRILFVGLIVSWEQDISTQMVTLRLEGLGMMAGKELAADQFFHADTRLPLVRVNDEESPTQTTKWDRYRFYGPFPVPSMLAQLTAVNPYLAMENNIIVPHPDDLARTETFTLARQPAELAEIVIDITLEDQNVEDFTRQLWAYMSYQWFFYIDYDEREEGVGSYEGSYYRPRLTIAKSAVNVFGVSIPRYTLHAGVHVTAQSLNFSGEEHATRVVFASQQFGTLNITSVPGSLSEGRFQATHTPQYEKYDEDTGRKDAEGRDIIIERSRITDDSRYRPRLVVEWPVPDTDPGSVFSEAQINPMVNDKKLQRKRIGFHRTYPVHTQQDIDINVANTPNAPVLLTQQASETFGRVARGATYTGSVSVVATDDRALEDYKLGDVVSFAGFNSILDYARGQIAGIKRTPFQAELKLNFVLPNIDRRLQAVERDSRLRQ